MAAGRFRGRKLLIAAAIAALLGTEAEAAPAGTVDFAVGDVTATATDGRQRAIAKGAAINSGDRILTNDGRAQIRFADGAYVSLQPDTDFAVREYRYEGKADGSERGLFGLVKGAMRTVTGVIGRVNRAAYQIQTPTATIGIRGTGGLISINPDTSTDLVGTSGIWTVTGLAPGPGLPPPQVDVPGGQAIRSTPQGQIQQLAQGPVVPPTPLQPKGQKQPTEAGSLGEPGGPGSGNAPGGNATSEIGTPVNAAGGPSGVTDAGGQPVVLPPVATAPAPPTPPTTPPPNPNPPLVSGPGFDLTYAYFEPMYSSAIGPVNVAQTSATFDSGGRMTSFNESSSVKSVAGTHAEFGTAGGVMAWGRWTGPVTLNGNPWADFATSKGLPYVVGVPAPISALAGSGTVTYNLIGATAPIDGTVTGSVTGGQLIANLGATPTVSLQNFSFSIASRTYVLNKSGMAITGPFTPFVGSLSGPSEISGSGGACATTCSGEVKGHFFGANASHAGIGYRMSDPSFSKNVIGAAGFAKP